MNQRLTLRMALMLTLPPLMWSANAVVGRLAVAHVPPLTLNFLRWVFALAILLPIGWRLFKQPGELARRWRYIALVSLLGVGAYNSLQYVALQTSTAINATLIGASLPMWMMTIGLLYGVRPTARQASGAVVSLAGVALVISRGSLDVLLHVRLVPGDLLMLLATAVWALYGWTLARPPAHMRGDQRPDWGWSEMLLAQVLFGAAWAALASGTEQIVTRRSIEWSAALVGALVFIAIGPSVIAYRCWTVGVARVGPTIAGFFSNMTPVFAAVMSAALLGEPPRWYHGVAFVLIMAGIVVSSRNPPQASVPGPQASSRDL
ncbi:MAG: EamA family transporter [Rhizobacter sp.]|nr:EamA family transporter [Rhizobacter sp.]